MNEHVFKEEEKSGDLIVETDAGSLKEAQEQLRSMVPGGFSLVYEQIVPDEEPCVIHEVADKAEKALEAAEEKVPQTAGILRKETIAYPEEKILDIEAFSKDEASAKAKQNIRKHERVKSVILKKEGRKGFLRIGRKPGLYHAKLFRKAIVELAYVNKLRIKVIAVDKDSIKDPKDYFFRLTQEEVERVKGLWKETVKKSKSDNLTLIKDGKIYIMPHVIKEILPVFVSGGDRGPGAFQGFDSLYALKKSKPFKKCVQALLVSLGMNKALIVAKKCDIPTYMMFQKFFNIFEIRLMDKIVNRPKRGVLKNFLDRRIVFVMTPGELSEMKGILGEGSSSFADNMSLDEVLRGTCTIQG